MRHNCDGCSYDSLFVKEVIRTYCGESTIEEPVIPPEPELPPIPVVCTATSLTFNEFNVLAWREARDYYIKNADFYGRLFDDHYSGNEVNEGDFLNVATRYAKSHSIIYGLPQKTRAVETSIGIEIEGNFIFADYNSFTGNLTGLEDLLSNSVGTKEVNYPGLPTYPEGTDVTRYFMYFWGYLEQYNPLSGSYEPMNNGELMIVGSSYLDIIPINQ